MLTMYQQITVKTLRKQGEAIQDIASSLHCHRNTVRNILSRDSITDKQTRERSSYFSPYKDIIKPFLSRDISRFRIWEILRDAHGSTKSYIALCSYIRREFPKHKEAYVVQQTKPGEEGEVDFGYLGKIQTADGRMRKVWGFVMVLACSRYAFYGIAFDQSVATFIALHVAAFSFFGGVVKRIKYDNLKAAVIKNSRYDLELNETFLRFAGHCNFIIAPCTPYQPQQKGKVESGVGYLKGNFWAGRIFTDEQDLVRQLKGWTDTVANVRVHGTTKRVPRDVFITQEKQCLQPLPDTTFVYTPASLRQVGATCHIMYENCYYSVPFSYVGETVEVTVSGETVRMTKDGKDLALHVRSHTPGTHVTNESHYPPYKIYSQTGYQAKYEEQMRVIGGNAHRFFTRCISEDPKGWVRTIRRVLGLVPVYGNETVEKALARALAFGAIRSVVVAGICEKKLENSPVEPFLLSRFHPHDIPTDIADHTTVDAGGDAQISQRTHQQEKQEESAGAVRDLSYYAALTDRTVTNTVRIQIDRDVQERGDPVSVQEGVNSDHPVHQPNL